VQPQVVDGSVRQAIAEQLPVDPGVRRTKHTDIGSRVVVRGIQRIDTQRVDGYIGSTLGAVPLMLVQEKVPLAPMAPRQACGVPKPAMTTTIVLVSLGKVEMSQIHREGSGAA